MTRKDQEIELPPQVILCEDMMAAWFESMLAATDQCFRFWIAPFAGPLDHEHEAPDDLDIPGPLERHHEHNLFA
ncbi:hypothetical protein [Erythrobacter alti]|uniref:hypothetical protein n=1 Tax=Erythrobacter alti TaxID=1896145 RepID=UPI0030F3A29C